MLTGFDVFLHMTLWFGLQKNPSIALASPAPEVVPQESAGPRIHVPLAAHAQVDAILTAWETSTIKNRRTGCSFRRFRNDHEAKTEYRAEGEINVTRRGGWEYQAQPTNVQPTLFRRKRAPGFTSYELQEDTAETLLASRNQVIIRRATPDGVEERLLSASRDFFGWSLPARLSPLIFRAPTEPRDVQPGDDCLVDVSGLRFQDYGLTPSAAAVPTFLLSMRRQEILKRYDVTLVEAKQQNWIGLRFTPQRANVDSAFGAVQIVLNRESFIPGALMLKSSDGKTEIVHHFGDWTFE